jgi:hypothetical protein
MRKLTAKEGQDLVSLIQRNAVAAGQAYDRQGQAFEAERQAEVAILEKAIELARPGLPSVVNAVEAMPQYMRRAELAPDLFILEDGRLARRTFPKGPDVMVRPADEVLNEFTLQEVIQPLAALFEKQVKGREPSTLAAEKRVAKLSAILELLYY